jgi:oligopeptide transport system permease protein
MTLKKKMESRGLNEFNQIVKPVSLWADAWRRMRKNKMAIAGLVVVALYVAVSVLCPAFGLIYPYEEQVIDHQSLPPSFAPAGETMIQKKEAYLKLLMAKQERTEMTEDEKADMAAFAESVKTDPVHQRRYLLGTDSLGRDLLSRIIYGGQISMMIGLIGTLTAVLIGILVGAFSGYLGGWVDNLIMRFVDIMYGLPYMLIVIIIRALFGKDMIMLFVAIAMVSWLTIARVVRGQIISLKNAEYVEAARSVGAGPGRIVLKHMVPNTMGIVVVFATLLIPSFILSESFLSFLGLGVSAPLASWGSLVSEGVKVMELYPWELLGPAIAMTVFLFAMNFLGDGLRDALDPQSKNQL